MYQTVYATENSTGASVVFNFSGDSKVTQGTKTVTYTISLGDFVGIPENAMMGYEAVLEYDSNVFSSATIEGLNDWTAQYTESTKRLIGETRTKGEANKEIAKITLTLKESLSNPSSRTLPPKVIVVPSCQVLASSNPIFSKELKVLVILCFITYLGLAIKETTLILKSPRITRIIKLTKTHLFSFLFFFFINTLP